MSAWTFELKTTDGEPITLTVHQGTGRWANTISKGGKLSDEMVYAYDATWTGADGEPRCTFITRNGLRRLRRAAAKQAEKDAEA